MMKHNFISIALAGLSILLSGACSPGRQETTKDSESVDSLSVEKHTTKVNSLKDVIPLIFEIAGPVSYTEQNMESGIEKAVKRDCGLLDQSIMPDSLNCEHDVAFVWKKTFSDFILIDVSTTFMSAKGQSILHHLFTVNENGNVIDIKPEWAGYYAIDVDNLEGETGAGEEWKSGIVAIMPVIRITSKLNTGEISVMEISPDGHFVAAGQQFNAETDLRGEVDSVDQR